MASFGHINQSGHKEVYDGRFGAYKVSIQRRPDTYKTEIAMCFRGLCVAQLFDIDQLNKMQFLSADQSADHALQMVARLLEQKIEEYRHQSMVSMSVGFLNNHIHTPSHHHQRMHEEQRREEARRRHEDCYLHAMSIAPPHHINIDVRSPEERVKKKKAEWEPPKQVGITLREQLQIETNDWLKEVRVA